MSKKSHVEIPVPLSDLEQAERVWVIASALPRAGRLEVLAACRAAGVKDSIAAAQYQRYRYGKKAAAIAAELPKRARNFIVRAAESGVEA